jgi:hypothetical protein
MAVLALLVVLTADLYFRYIHATFTHISLFHCRHDWHEKVPQTYLLHEERLAGSILPNTVNP